MPKRFTSYPLTAPLTALLAALLAGQFLCAPALAEEAVAPSNGLSPAACAVTPMPRVKEDEWMSVAKWKEIHAAQQAVAKQGGIDLMFVGDSITQGWPHDFFEQQFGRFHAANFGVGGDHTGNVLYRLDDPVMATLKPRAIVLLVGVNNFFHCADNTAQTFAGIRQVVATLRQEYPDARILLNAVLPYGEANEEFKREQVRELNRMVAALDDGKHVFYRDYGPRFLQADGTIPTDVMADHLHPTAKGYRIWADAMLPDIEQLMK
jgi:lysophospholipase L1-like esterase